ncbi:GNAT family N-acetyltransferase [Alteromonas sp. CYL-A6]|uniref:GNAT family N-acetyltransferase n=1 Tax=Alteromonas nitratireducens TaxID=3390813 RepID=UPI0034C50175
MPVRCRLACEADLPVLNGFQRGIIRAEECYIPRRKQTDYQYYDLALLLNDPDTRIVVAEHDATLIGSGYVQKRASKAYLEHAFHGYVGFIFTRPEFRGQGVASAVLDALADQARNMGLDELRLDVFADNDTAIRTYERAGYQRNTLEMRRPL